MLCVGLVDPALLRGRTRNCGSCSDLNLIKRSMFLIKRSMFPLNNSRCSSSVTINACSATANHEALQFQYNAYLPKIAVHEAAALNACTQLRKHLAEERFASVFIERIGGSALNALFDQWPLAFVQR